MYINDAELKEIIESAIRERFGLSLKKQSTISNLIKECMNRKLIKKFDPDSASKKYQKYIPIWA